MTPESPSNAGNEMAVGAQSPPGRQGRLPLAGHRLSAIVGLIVAFGWTFALTGRSPALTNIHNDLVTIAAEWCVVIVLAVITLAIQKRHPRDFGLRMFGRRDLRAMLAALVASYVLVGVANHVLTLNTASLDVRHLLSVPFSVKAGLVVTAGVCEEIMYRGFAIEELAGLTGSLWVGGVISWLAFTLAHIDRYGLTTGLLIPAIVGGFLTLLYVWRRNLPVCMLLHAIMDGVSIFLIPMVMRGQ